MRTRVLNIIMSKLNNLLAVGNLYTRFCVRRELRGYPKIRVSKVQSSEESGAEPPLPKQLELQENEQTFSRLLLKQSTSTSTSKFYAEEKKPKNRLSFCEVTEDNMHDRLFEAVVPLHRVPYFKQLKIKHTKCMTVLQQLCKQLRSKNLYITRDSKGLPCPLEQVRPSPENTAYRNKDEFGIRCGIDGNPKTVGFFIGSPSENDKVICVQPKEVINIKPIHLSALEHFQQYIRQSSLPACIDFHDNGNWHRLHVRSNIHGELMVVIIMHPRNLTQEEIESEKEKIKHYFLEGQGKELNLKSLYFQACPHSRCSNEQAQFQLLFGEPYIFEQIGNMRLRVSPETFLQVNSFAAPVLFDTIRDLAGITSSTTVLDVCCGSGSIGIHLAEKANRVIGIEISRQATEDAKFNIQTNGVKNMAVLNGAAELIVPRVMEDFYSDDLVAVVNPSRGGMKYSLISALRECKHLRRIVYVACKPEGNAMQNFIQLCEAAGKRARFGKPFMPLYAIPVDMFPHTKHCELVIMFERVTV